MTSTSKDGTVYALRDPRTNEIRYVGWAKNARKRFRQHINEARNRLSESSWKVRWIRTLFLLNLEPELQILQKNAKDALKAEVRWIRTCRAQGCKLTNMTDGGEGVINLPKESLDRLKKKARKQWSNSELRKKNVDAQREARKNPQFRERCIESAQRVAVDPKQRKKRSENAKKRWSDPKFKNRVSKSIKKSHNTPEFRKRMSDAAKARWADPEFKNRVSKIIQRSMQAKAKTEPFKEQYKRHSRLVKKRMQDPVNRKKVSDGLKRYNAQKKAEAIL